MLVIVDGEELPGGTFTQVFWFEDGAAITLAGFGVGSDEIDAAIAGAHRAGQEPTVVEPPEDEMAVDEGAGNADQGSIDDLIATVVPEGLDLAWAGDHRDLGPSDWDTEICLFGPEQADRPAEGDPVLAVAVSPASAGLLIGDPIEAGGSGLSEREILAVARSMRSANG